MWVYRFHVAVILRAADNKIYQFLSQFDVPAKCERYARRFLERDQLILDNDSDAIFSIPLDCHQLQNSRLSSSSSKHKTVHTMSSYSDSDFSIYLIQC